MESNRYVPYCTGSLGASVPDPLRFGPDPDLAPFFNGFQDAKKIMFFYTFFCLVPYIHLHQSSTVTKFVEKSQNCRSQGFSKIFFLSIEGSGSVQNN